MKNDIEQMLLSTDKDAIYLASIMIREQPDMFTSSTKKVLKQVSLFDRIKNYSDVCKELDESELTIKDFHFLPKQYRIKSLNQAKIQQIQKLFNRDWKVNFKDGNQRKWYPYFEYKASGGLVFRDSFDHFSSFSDAVGYYKDKETSDFIGKTFLDIYKNIL